MKECASYNRGATALEWLFLIVIIAFVGIPILIRFTGLDIFGQRKTLVALIAQDRKTPIPNSWFGGESGSSGNRNSRPEPPSSTDASSPSSGSATSPSPAITNGQTPGTDNPREPPDGLGRSTPPDLNAPTETGSSEAFLRQFDQFGPQGFQQDGDIAAGTRRRRGSVDGVDVSADSSRNRSGILATAGPGLDGDSERGGGGSPVRNSGSSDDDGMKDGRGKGKSWNWWWLLLLLLLLILIIYFIWTVLSQIRQRE